MSINNVVNAAILSFLTGLFCADYQYDSPWYNDLTTSKDYLKSKVTASIRNDAYKHYSNLITNGSKQLYAMLLFTFILCLSLVGLIARKKNLGANLVTFVGVLVGSFAQFWFVYEPLIAFQKKSRPAPIAEATYLRDIALGHVVGLFVCVFGLALQMGTLENLADMDNTKGTNEVERESFYPYAPKKKKTGTADSKKSETKKDN